MRKLAFVLALLLSKCALSPLAFAQIVPNADGSLPIRGSSTVSSANSTTSTLSGGAAFTGTFESVADYAAITVIVFADEASAANGLEFQWSPDGTNADFTELITVAADVGRTFVVAPRGRYFRVKYTNGGAAQGAFRLSTIYKAFATGDFSYVEDMAHLTADKGAFILCVRNDSATTTFSGTDGDYTPFACDSAGKLFVTGTVTSDTELPSAAALADDTANPTTTSVGTFAHWYDGTTWDRARGTSADGLLVNLGGNNDVTVTGTVTANAGTDLNTSALLTTTAHDAAFGTAGSADSQVRTIQGVASMTPVEVSQDTAADLNVTVTDGSGALTVDGTVTVTDGSGALNVIVDSGTTAVTQGTASSLNAEVQGDAAHDTAVSGNPLLQGGYASATAPSDVSGDGDAVRAWHLRNGAAVFTLQEGGVINDVLDLTNSNPQTVAIVDGDGTQITSFGGGTQYTEGDTDSSITGTAALWEDTSNTLRAVSAAKPLPVNVMDDAGNISGIAANPLIFASDGTAVAVTPHASANPFEVAGDNVNPIIACTSSAAISVSTSGNNEIVALTTDDVIYVCSFSLVTRGTVEVQWVYGTGSACGTSETDLTGPYSFQAREGLSQGSGLGTLFRTAASNALCLELSGNVQVDGVVSYAKY